MYPIKQDDAVPELESWGTVADLGSEILEGECKASGKMVFGAPDAAVACAYFAVTRGRFRMVYPFTEHAVVVEGQVTLTHESSGASSTYGPGDGWFIQKGTPVVWEIAGERFVKNYLSIV
jgi:uncharacterized cupin superfamily protein